MRKERKNSGGYWARGNAGTGKGETETIEKILGEGLSPLRKGSHLRVSGGRSQSTVSEGINSSREGTD